MGDGLRQDRAANLITWRPCVQRFLSASVGGPHANSSTCEVLPNHSFSAPFRNQTPSTHPKQYPFPTGKHHIISPHPQTTYRCHWDPQVTGEAQGGHPSLGSHVSNVIVINQGRSVPLLSAVIICLLQHAAPVHYNGYCLARLRHLLSTSTEEWHSCMW